MISIARNDRAIGLVALFGILGLWELVCRLGWISPLLLAAPHDIVLWLGTHLTSISLWIDILVTTRRVCLAFVLSAAIGIPLGMAMGYFPVLEKILTLPVDFCRSIPATALFPLFLIFFGSNEGPRVAAAIYGASLIIAINTMSGIKQADTIRVQAAKVMGATGLELFRRVLLPEAMPSILIGLRLGVSLAFVIVVLVEMFVGTTAGIGQQLIDAQTLYEIPEVYALIFIAGLLGYVINQLFVFMERRIAHYVGR
jgi:ABC-type nitrate/sulfonate/bicarbonate transport system permease component